MENNFRILINAYSLIILLILCIVFFVKKRLHKVEDNVYGGILISSFITITIGLILGVIVTVQYMSFQDFYIIFFNKLYMSGILFVISLFCYYTYYISSKKTENIKKNRIKLLIILNIINLLLVSVLPLEINRKQGEITTSGVTFNYFFIVFMIIYFIMVLMILKDYKNIRNKKYIPIMLLVFSSTILNLLMSNMPELNFLLNPLFVINIIIMYFTIENPDVKMIEQLNVARNEADKANQAKSDFLSSMSHEIRTPLNAIVGFSEALSEEDISDSAKDEVNDIIMASNSLLEIVNGILDISKIESGKIEIVNKEYQFKKVYDELVILAKGRLGDKPLDFRCYYDESIPKIFYGDYTRVKQVILNILTNAIKYTKEGYIIFSVSSITKDDICRLIISVEDTGIGIKQENIPYLFSKFERFDLDKNITIEGTGLGLAITKKLVELMNGKIVVQSIYGQGSKFTISIDQRIIYKEVVEEKKEQKEVKNIDVSGKKVLIVDDNKINLKVASRLLENYKLDITTVESGFECLEKVKETTYDLILMDDMMPKMGGVETLHKLKEDENFKIPVIALTANAITGMKEKYLQEGFNDYLAKPINRDELNELIMNYLGK